jgi:aminoglycoside phosphotransferase (APT) family kinase protein
VDAWQPPEVVPDGVLPVELAADAVAALARELPALPRGPRVLNHGDFHPGNLLWDRSRLSGIVDWGHTRVGYRAWELAYFRLEVSLLVDTRAAEEMTERYWKEAGLPPEPMEPWDLFCAFGAHRWVHMWMVGYREMGRKDLRLDELGARLGSYVRRALASLNG